MTGPSQFTKAVRIGEVCSLLSMLVGYAGMSSLAGVQHGSAIYLLLNLFSALPWMYFAFLASKIRQKPVHAASLLTRMLSCVVAISGIATSYCLWELDQLAWHGSEIQPHGILILAAVAFTCFVGVPSICALSYFLAAGPRSQFLTSSMFGIGLAAPFLICLSGALLQFNASNRVASLVAHASQTAGLLVAFEGLLGLHRSNS